VTEGVVELLHVDRPQHQPGVAEKTLARRQAEIERPIDDVGAPETGVAVAFAHAQDGDSGQMSTCGFAADGQDVSGGAAPRLG
jgi:hypothetical protein